MSDLSQDARLGTNDLKLPLGDLPPIVFENEFDGEWDEPRIQISVASYYLSRGDGKWDDWRAIVAAVKELIRPAITIQSLCPGEDQRECGPQANFVHVVAGSQVVTLEHIRNVVSMRLLPGLDEGWADAAIKTLEKAIASQSEDEPGLDESRIWHAVCHYANLSHQMWTGKLPGGKSLSEHDPDAWPKVIREIKASIRTERANDEPLVTEYEIGDGRRVHWTPKGLIVDGVITDADKKWAKFSPDPESRASRMIEAARIAFADRGQKRMTFAELCKAVPANLLATARAREEFRTTIIRAGKRAGICYENAQSVISK